MAIPRLLTNSRVTGEDVLSPPEAVLVYRRLLVDERVRFEPEPAHIENTWISWMSMSAASGSTWTDAYLAAFAIEADFRLISFDRGMRRWPGLAFEVSMPIESNLLDHRHTRAS
jgi:predicted nucleic acid-binding protein